MIVFPPLTATPPTNEEKLQRITDGISIFFFEAYKEYINIQNESIRRVWDNQQFTPQQIFDALSAKAPVIIDYHNKLTTMITEIAAIEGITPDILYPTNAYTISGNQVIVSNDPYIP